MDILGASPKPQLSKTTMDCFFGTPLVLIISNAKMITSITSIATKACATILNGLVQLFFQLVWAMFPLKGLDRNVTYDVQRVCALLCAMLG